MNKMLFTQEICSYTHVINSFYANKLQVRKAVMQG